MPPLCKGRCPSSQTGAEGLGGRQFRIMKSNANSYNDIMLFRIGLCHIYTACCPIPPTPLYTRGACAQKPSHGPIQPTAKLQFVFLLRKKHMHIKNRCPRWYGNSRIIVSTLALGGEYSIDGEKSQSRMAAGFTAGKVAVITSVFSSGLSARIFPLWAVTMPLAMARPRP